MPAGEEPLNGFGIMKDLALERVWQSRRAISELNGFDSRRLVTYYQRRAEDKQLPQPSVSHIRRADKVAETAEPLT